MVTLFTKRCGSNVWYQGWPWTCRLSLEWANSGCIIVLDCFLEVWITPLKSVSQLEWASCSIVCRIQNAQDGFPGQNCMGAQTSFGANPALARNTRSNTCIWTWEKRGILSVWLEETWDVSWRKLTKNHLLCPISPLFFPSEHKGQSCYTQRKWSMSAARRDACSCNENSMSLWAQPLCGLVQTVLICGVQEFPA